MKMKLTLPENIKDITLDQYQKFEKLKEREYISALNFNKRVVSIFTELKINDINKISQKDYDEILIQITTALQEDAKFENRFKIGGMEFGFIPNLDKITTAEFVDLSGYGIDIENLHKTMAILFRPITGTDAFGNYTIESYNGTERYKELMKQSPISIVNGALFFFQNLATELRIHILKYTREVQAKEEKHQGILKSMAGI